MTLIKGDSTVEVVKHFGNSTLVFDFIHVDGGHTSEIATIDMRNAYRYARNDCIVVLDDTEYSHLKKIWNSYIRDGKLQEYKILLTNHNIGRFLKQISL